MTNSPNPNAIKDVNHSGSFTSGLLGFESPIGISAKSHMIPLIVP